MPPACQAGQQSNHTILRVCAIAPHLFLCQGCHGCLLTTADKRIPALCCASVDLTAFVVDLHCFRLGGRWLHFCSCQLEDVFLQRGATICCWRNGCQYLPLQHWFSLYSILLWARSGTRSGILCSSQWNRCSWWKMGNFNGQSVEFLIIAAGINCRC